MCCYACVSLYCGHHIYHITLIISYHIYHITLIISYHIYHNHIIFESQQSISSDDYLCDIGKHFYTSFIILMESMIFSNYNNSRCELTCSSVIDSVASDSWPWDDETDVSVATETL